MNAVLATDAHVFVDYDRSLIAFRDRLHRADRRAHGKLAVHAAIARPDRGKTLENRRLHGDPVGSRDFVDARSRMVIPIFAGMYALPATNALRGVEENGSWLAVEKCSRRDQRSVLFTHRADSISRIPRDQAVPALSKRTTGDVGGSLVKLAVFHKRAANLGACLLDRRKWRV